MARTLVVYYSFEGNTRLVAGEIAKAAEAEILEIKPVDEMKSHGFTKFVWGGRQAVLKEEPKLQPFDRDPAKYDLVVIGTPVWAYTFSPPIRTFFKTAGKALADKKVALFCCHEGGPKQTLDKMAAQVMASDVIGKKDFFAPLKKDREATLKAAREWSMEMVKALEKTAEPAKVRAGVRK